MKVEKIMSWKGRRVPHVHPDAKIADVIGALEAKDVGAVIVSTDGERIEGILSERDVVRGLERYKAKLLDKRARDLMTKKVVTCTSHDPVAGVMALMDSQHIRHVPVVDDGKLAGIVSIRDIIKLRLDQVQAEADAMRAYIASGK